MSKASELLQKRITISKATADNENFLIQISIKEGQEILAELEKEEKQPEPKCETCGDTRKVEYEPDDIQSELMIPCPDCQQPEPTELTKTIQLNVKNWEKSIQIDDCRIRSIIDWLGQVCDTLDRQATEIKELEEVLEIVWMESGSHQCFTDWFEQIQKEHK